MNFEDKDDTRKVLLVIGAFCLVASVISNNILFCIITLCALYIINKDD